MWALVKKEDHVEKWLEIQAGFGCWVVGFAQCVVLPLSVIQILDHLSSSFQ